MASPEKSKEQLLSDLLAFRDTVRKFLKTPRLSPATLKIRLARALRDLESPETTIIKTSDRPSIREIADRMEQKKDA